MKKPIKQYKRLVNLTEDQFHLLDEAYKKFIANLDNNKPSISFPEFIRLTLMKNIK